MQHKAAFHPGLHCLQRLKQPSGTEIHHNLGNFTCDPLMYTIGSPILIVSIRMGKSSEYCTSGNFRENFIFANSVKRHIYDVKYSRLGHDFSISVNDRVISPFREEFVFTKLCEVSRK